MKCVYYPGSIDIELVREKLNDKSFELPPNECSDDGEAITVIYSNAYCSKHLSLRFVGWELDIEHDGSWYIE